MDKILLKCLSKIGPVMTGPAIRYWEMAKYLSKKYDVTLLAETLEPVLSTDFKIENDENKIDFAEYVAVISQVFDYKMVLKAKYYGVKLIYDAYDPEPFEHLEIFKHHSMNKRKFQQEKILQNINFTASMADAYLCASEKQKDLWTGLLLAIGKLNPSFYDADSSLKSSLKIVPFGLSSKPPEKTNAGFREKYQLLSDDKVLVWGGGIWNWFDPLSLVEAMHLLTNKRPDIKLIFMGSCPNDVDDALKKMALDAKDYSDHYQLTNKTVFFNDHWIAYDDRGSFLLDADIGISTHFDHLETRYSFRTRLLDYIWAELPIIATKGDTFADIIEKENIGVTLDSKNPALLAHKIETLLDNKAALKLMKANLKKIKEQFIWDKAFEPMDELIENLKEGKKNSLSFSDLLKITNLTIKKLQSHIFHKIRGLL